MSRPSSPRPARLALLGTLALAAAGSGPAGLAAMRSCEVRGKVRLMRTTRAFNCGSIIESAAETELRMSSASNASPPLRA